MKEIKAHSRFKGAPWYEHAKTLKVDVGGAGSIGSWVAFFLARIGYSIRLWDFDSVEEENLSGQFFSKEDIGNKKTISTLAQIESFCIQHPKQRVTLKGKFEEGKSVFPMCFSCFDDMDARKALYKTWKKEHGKDIKAIFIDGRLLGESMQIFVVRGNVNEEQKEYEKTLYTNDETYEKDREDLLCSYKYTTHMAASIASDMVKCANNHITNLIAGKTKRRVPMYIFHEGILLQYEIK